MSTDIYRWTRPETIAQLFCWGRIWDCPVTLEFTSTQICQETL